MRRSRLKKERELAQQQGAESGPESANNGPGYHHVEHEDGNCNLIRTLLVLNTS